MFGRCNVCGERFYAGQEDVWQAHVGPCARRNLDEIMHERGKRKDVFTESADPELEDYMLGVGRKLLAEGRWERRPNEMVHDA